MTTTKGTNKIGCGTAELLLRLLLENRFPQLWVPSLQQRDLRQLLLHRHKQVACGGR